MKRATILIAISLLSAALSIANLIDFRLQHLLDPVNHDTITLASAIAALLLLLLILWLTVRSGASNATFAIMIGAMLLTGFVPRGVDALQHKLQDDQRRSEAARTQTEFLTELAARRKDVEGRAAEHRAYSGEEAADFIAFVQRSDLSWMSLPDYSDVAFPLLERCLTAKILDPNSAFARGGQRAPVFVDFYDKNIRPTKTAIRVRDWKILELLVAGGANLAVAEAQPISADLARKQILGPDRFMRLE